MTAFPKSKMTNDHDHFDPVILIRGTPFYFAKRHRGSVPVCDRKNGSLAPVFLFFCHRRALKGRLS